MKPISRRTWLRRTGGGVLAVGLAAAGPARSGAETGEVDDDMVVIPAGPFQMGTSREEAEEIAEAHGYHVSWLSGEWPVQEIDLPAYAIDRYPVTNAQYLAYIEDTDAEPPHHWRGGRPARTLRDHPVVGINQPDAEAYARWAGKRLPTEAEWEKAARGPEALRFPWGDTFQPDACQWSPDPNVPTPGAPPVTDHVPLSAQEVTGPPPGTAAVTAHPEGASPYGVMDMVGNAAEWCAGSPGGGSGFIRGGGFIVSDPINLRAASRIMSGWATNRNPWYGFRCARSIDQ